MFISLLNYLKGESSNCVVDHNSLINAGYNSESIIQYDINQNDLCIESSPDMYHLFDQGFPEIIMDVAA